MADLLLKDGASVSRPLNSGGRLLTLLQQRKKHPEMVEVLLKNGAEASEIALTPAVLILQYSREASSILAEFGEQSEKTSASARPHCRIVFSHGR
jgi:hypothetical protein